MPQIKPFEAGPLDLRPSEIGVEATAAAGRRLGSFYNQVAGATAEVGRRAGSEIGSAIQSVGTEAVNQITAHQVAHGAATFAKISDDITNQWNEIVKNADPNDPAVAAKFKETVLEPKLQEWNTGFNTEAGQKWAEAHVEHLRSHMFEKTSADMMTLAKQAASNNAHQTLNELSNTVYNDPSGLKFALDTFGSSLNGIVDSSPNLKGTAAAEVKTTLTEKGREQLVKAAAIGSITKTGQVPDWVKDPAYSKYVNGPELETFRKNAEAVQKSNAYYDRQAAVLQKQQADLAVHKGATDLFANNVTVDPNNPERVMVAPDFMKKALDIARNNPDAPSAAATVKTLVDWAESQHNREAKITDDPAARQDLLSRMGATDNPTTEIQILRADADRKLSPGTRGEFLRLQKAIQERPEGESIKRTRDNFNRSFARLIDGDFNATLGQHSVLGTQRMYEFEMDARRQEAELIKQGKDPGLIYDPRSPEFWGRPENIARYRVSLQEAQGYEKTLKAMDAVKARAPKPTSNLTGPNVETLPRVRNKADYEKLEPGASFSDDNGNRWTKPEKKK